MADEVYSVPVVITGYGNLSTARNVMGFEIGASDELSALLKYEAYDNNQVFPTVDSVLTNDNDLFVGTTGNGNISMVCLIDTSNAAPSSDWKPATPTAGEANPNRMKGQTNYVEQDGSPLGNNGRATYNMVNELPSDATTAMAMQMDLLFRFSYTQAVAPVPKIVVNRGTEVTPIWVELTPGSQGIKHCKAGSSASECYATIPPSGLQDTEVAIAMA